MSRDRLRLAKNACKFAQKQMLGAFVTDRFFLGVMR